MTALTTITFIILCLTVFAGRDERKKLKEKSSHEWTLDLAGLFIQGSAIPFLQASGLAVFARLLFPQAAGSLEMPFLFAFALNFFVVDYIYYWNHRLLHRGLWDFHKVHHSVRQFDVLATSRNSIWSSFLIVYLWINGFFLYLLKDPTPFALGMALTASLDLWRHSPVGKSQTRLQDFLSRYLGLITPAEHAVHHNSKARANFGANFNLFDKLHGTYGPQGKAHWEDLGIATGLSLKNDLFFPWRKEEERS